MKNRRLAIIAFILVAIMAIGVGYANLTDTLQITGSAGVNRDDSAEAFDADIRFTKAVGDTSRVTSTIGDKDETGDNDKVTITVLDGILKEVGDEIIVTCTVTSDSDLDVYIAAPTVTNNNSEYFSVTTTWDGTTTVVPAGTAQTRDVVVTIKLIKTAVADQDATFTIDLNASTAAPTT